MIKKIRLISAIVLMTCFTIFILLNWSINTFLFPRLRGLERLGSSLFFPKALPLDFENQNMLLFLNIGHASQPGYNLYHYQFGRIWPRRVLKNFLFRDIKFSPEKNRIAFIGWGNNSNRIWLSTRFNPPVPLENDSTITLEPLFLDWSSQGDSIIFVFDEIPNRVVFMNLDISHGTYSPIYSMVREEGPFDGISVMDGKIAYTTEKLRQAISIMDMKDNQVRVLNLGARDFRNIQFMKKSPWLIGIQVSGSEGGYDQLAFINYENQCVVLPFPDLQWIDGYSFIETENNLLIVLSDKERRLYHLDVKEALQISDISEFLFCQEDDR